MKAAGWGGEASSWPGGGPGRPGPAEAGVRGGEGGARAAGVRARAPPLLQTFRGHEWHTSLPVHRAFGEVVELMLPLVAFPGSDIDRSSEGREGQGLGRGKVFGSPRKTIEISVQTKELSRKWQTCPRGTCRSGLFQKSFNCFKTTRVGLLKLQGQKIAEHEHGSLFRPVKHDKA